MMSKTKTTVITAALLVLISSPAMAQCAQDQLAGNWTLLGSTAAGAWNRCDLEIDPAGAYTGVCIGTNRPRRGDEVNGTLRLRRTCELRGSIAGEGFRLPLNGVLLESGDIGAGINRFGDPELNLGLLFTLIRRPAAP